MTDLITKLADDIHALIQASPRSPTKEEIAAVLRDDMVNSDILSADTVGNLYAGGVCIGWGSLSMPERPAGYLVSQEDWVNGINADSVDALCNVAPHGIHNWLPEYADPCGDHIHANVLRWICSCCGATHANERRNDDGSTEF